MPTDSAPDAPCDATAHSNSGVEKSSDPVQGLFAEIAPLRVLQPNPVRRDRRVVAVCSGATASMIARVGLEVPVHELKPSWPVGRAVTAIDHEIGKVVADHLANRVNRLGFETSLPEQGKRWSRRFRSKKLTVGIRPTVTDAG